MLVSSSSGHPHPQHDDQDTSLLLVDPLKLACEGCLKSLNDEVDFLTPGSRVDWVLEMAQVHHFLDEPTSEVG